MVGSIAFGYCDCGFLLWFWFGLGGFLVALCLDLLVGLVVVLFVVVLVWVWFNLVVALAHSCGFDVGYVVFASVGVGVYYLIGCCYLFDLCLFCLVAFRIGFGVLARSLRWFLFRFAFFLGVTFACCFGWWMIRCVIGLLFLVDECCWLLIVLV